MDAPSWIRDNKIWIGVAVGCALAIGVIVALAGKHSNQNTALSVPSGITASTTPQICPLTGVPSPRGNVPQRPALAMKVDNAPPARPQSGLNSADLVFEEPVEGGLTRLVAVFQCKSSNLVGPLRSARQPDVGIINMLSDPIFVHVGGIDPVLSLIQSANTKDDDLNSDVTTIIHPPGRNAPYDTYVSTSSQWSKHSDATPPSPVFTFSSDLPNGTSISSMQVPFSNSSDNVWSWNSHTSSWNLSVDGTPLDDGINPVAVANVVVLAVQTSEGPWIENNLGAHEVEVDSTSGGAARILRNGVSITGSWQRSSESQPIQLTDNAGKPILLAPGETWIEMLPSSIATSSQP